MIDERTCRSPHDGQLIVDPVAGAAKMLSRQGGQQVVHDVFAIEDQDCPGHRGGDAEIDGAAVRIQLVAERVDADLPTYRQHLCGERLVQLDDVHVLDAANYVVHADGNAVVLYGVHDLVVVSRDGLTLVTTTDRAADLKKLIESLPPRIREQA